MSVNLLKQVYRNRITISEMPEDEKIDGIHITSKFLCNFGYMGRGARHALFMNGLRVGFFEEIIPWSLLKESSRAYLLDIAISSPKGINFNLTEDPYSEKPLWYPYLDNPREAVRVARLYFPLD